MSSDLMRDIDPTGVETIRAKYGDLPAEEYNNMYAARRREVDAKIDRLEASDDEDFVEYASWAILDSARMSGFRGNYEDLHVVATIAYRISEERALANNTDPSCRVHSLYQQAWVRAYTEEGHPYDRSEDKCTCNKE